MSRDLIERLRRMGQDTNRRWGPAYIERAEADMLRAADRIAALETEAVKHERALLTVQNAAKTLASARGTELEHLRQNHAFDHKLRAEHDSLIERDALMTDALLKAEARIAALEAEASEGERRGLERAIEAIEGTSHVVNVEGDMQAWCDGYDFAEEAAVKAIRALIPEAPAREGE